MNTKIVVDLTQLGRGMVLITGFTKPEFDVYVWLGEITSAPEISVMTWRGYDVYVAHNQHLAENDYKRIAHKLVSVVYEDGFHNDVVYVQMDVNIDFNAN